MFEQITQGYTIIRIKQNILLTIKDSNFFSRFALSHCMQKAYIPVLVIPAAKGIFGIIIYMYIKIKYSHKRNKNKT